MFNPNDSKSRTPPMPEPSYSSHPEAGYPYPQHPSNVYGMGPPPAYEGSSSSRTTPPADSTNGPSMMSRLQGSVGANPADILNNAAPGFSRVPPSTLPYSPFPNCALVSLSHELDKGFPALAPPVMVQPHPFALHDIHEADWVRFLSDVKKAGTLSPMNHVVAGVAPLAMGVGLFGILVSRGIEKRMKKKKVGPVTEIIDHWNYYFFNPRQTEVILFQGDHVQSGTAQALSRDTLPDSSDPEEYNDRRQSRGGRLGERRTEMRGEMGGRRGQRRQERQVQKEKWQLVVSYKPPTPYY